MARIKDSLVQLLGKTIQSVVVCRNPDSEPTSQLFLVFKDGTSYEFWVDQGQLSMASKTDDEDMEKVVSLASQREGTKVHVVQSSVDSIDRVRIESEPSAAKNNPLEGIGVSDIDDENALFLAIHRRDALLCLIASVEEDAEVLAWVDLVSAAFGSMLQRCNLSNLDRLYQDQSRWNDVVRPPSVIAPELMQFLGGLSVVNTRVYERLEDRGTIEAFLALDLAEHFERGQDRGRELLELFIT